MNYQQMPRTVEITILLAENFRMNKKSIKKKAFVSVQSDSSNDVCVRILKPMDLDLILIIVCKLVNKFINKIMDGDYHDLIEEVADPCSSFFRFAYLFLFRSEKKREREERDWAPPNVSNNTHYNKA